VAEDLGERTEEPTERRRIEARERGQVARSTDLSAAILLLAAVVLAIPLAEFMLRGLTSLVRHTLGPEMLGVGLTLESLAPDLRLSGFESARMAVPAMLVLSVIALAGSMTQVGLGFSMQPLEPRPERLNAVRNLSRLANRRAFVKGLLDLAKMLAIAGIAWTVISADYSRLAALANTDLAAGMIEVAKMSRDLALWIVALLLILGIIDFRYQRWQWLKDLRMTKQEVKDERKASEGDPDVKARRLRLARQVALQRIGLHVPKADVVVTNPTHFAVALKYDPQARMRAPRVIAKGADYLAMKIRYVAAAAGVPVLERPALARALYAQVPVGKEIPPEHYEAVAEVLAFVYRMENRSAA